MAKKTGITIATIAVIIGIALGLSTLGGRLWGQGAKHAVQAEQVKAVIEAVKILKPEVKKNTEGRTQVQTDIEWIKGAVQRIEKKL